MSSKLGDSLFRNSKEIVCKPGNEVEFHCLCIQTCARIPRLMLMLFWIWLLICGAMQVSVARWQQLQYGSKSYPKFSNSSNKPGSVCYYYAGYFGIWSSTIVPHLRIPGLNAPNLYATGFVYYPGGWGKSPVDEYFAERFFYWKIPRGITEPKELEVLDLEYKNFSRPIPPELGSNLSLMIFLLDHNELQAW
ncbi:hypothetical protein COLO4_31167 [Corchorus olitorius]|uniref:Uncharacterized protein n=1 Tax=Corchorus olitorius TaxID=93759 RepID=A0A1R3H585_9ROSI|nr:hypothetical protein COLO4_31167 [Corchorus olitorius]